MSREELIDAILQFNDFSHVRLSHEELERYSTETLQTLLLSDLRRYQSESGDKR